MKREEKNQQTRRKIMDNALLEFSQQGYGASSINTICAARDVSKGIIYHYFKSKDDLFLACVEECFQLLTDYLKTNLQFENLTPEKRMEKYFTARLNFFKTHPGYQRIFCEAVITPPVHLKAEIQERKQMFDDLNDEILKELLSPVALRPAITREDALETFRQFQDFINARYQMAEVGTLEFTAREQNCRKALDILLYGVIDTSGLSHNT